MTSKEDPPAGDWLPSTFPYNLDGFTASGAAHTHPDLPSEPPGYDEFEFSFPSELSPSLFTRPLPFGDNVDSPTTSSFPALSSKGGSPTASHANWPIEYSSTLPPLPTHPHLQRNPYPADLPSKPGIMPELPKRLFKDNERSALNAFFSETLGQTVGMTRSASMGGASAQRMQGVKRRNSTVAAGTSYTAGPGRLSAAKLDENVFEDDEEEDETNDTDYRAPVALAQPPAKRSRLSVSISASVAAPSNATAKASSVSNTSASKRSNHIASEQRRRTTIKENYKSLVDLLLAGEETSGISLANAEEEEAAAAGGAKKTKPKGRGRGRKGQDGAGATKSVVLEKAADYLRWLEQGNSELQEAIANLESGMVI